MNIYLAGSITGCSYKGCTEWREEVERVLKEVGFNAYSPMRGKEYLKRKRKIASTADPASPYGNHGIFQRDKFDVSHCDILLANLVGSEIASIGTVMEIAWASLMNKYIVAVIEDGNIHEHAFVLEAASLVFDDLDEAVDYIIKTFGGNNGGRTS